MEITLETIEWILGGILALSVVVEITPIKINPWGWLLRKIGRETNSELFDKVSDIEKKIDDHIVSDERESIKQCRNRILRFNDEILSGVLHTKEHFDEILDDIDTYERYCNNHADYPNSKANMSIRNIREVYEKCLKERSFLTVR